LMVSGHDSEMFIRIEQCLRDILHDSKCFLKLKLTTSFGC
jgi:hypothetical protein